MLDLCHLQDIKHRPGHGNAEGKGRRARICPLNGKPDSMCSTVSETMWMDTNIPSVTGSRAMDAIIRMVTIVIFEKRTETVVRKRPLSFWATTLFSSGPPSSPQKPITLPVVSSFSLTKADIHLGVGAPLTRMGAEKQTYLDYYNRIRELSFKYEDMSYNVKLLSVNVFPQGYAGVVDYMKGFRRSSLVIDIGSWTVDILPLSAYIPDQTRCKSLPLGTITCMNDINEGLRQKFGQDADETTIKDVMIHGTSDIPADYLAIIRTGLMAYVKNLMDQIRALNFNPDLTQFVFIGGGAGIMKHFLSEGDKKNCLIYDDVHINAKGYENLIRRKIGG